MVSRVHQARKIVEVAFGNSPTDSVYNWVDVTPWLKDTSGHAFSVGRQNELQQFDAGNGGTVLMNNDRRFEPQYANSPYYPGVDVETPIQFSLEYPWLPGVLSDGAFEFGTDNWSVTNATLAQQAPGTGWLYPAAHSLRATSTVTGTVTLMSPPVIATTVPTETWYASLRFRGSDVTNTVSIGVIFYSDLAGTVPTFPQFTTVPVNPSTTAWKKAGIGPNGPNGSTQTCRLVVTWASTTPGDTLDISHAVLDQVAVATDKTVMQLGYVDDWLPNWNLGDNQVTVTWHDGFKLLGFKNINNRNFENEVISQGWQYYWPLNEPLGSRYVYDIGAGNHQAVVGLYGDGIFGIDGPLIADPSTGVDFYGGLDGAGPAQLGTGWFSLPDACAMTSAAAWSMMLAFKYTGPSDRLIQQGPTGDPRTISGTNSINFWDWYINSDGTMQFSSIDAVGNTYAFNTNWAFANGIWYFMVLVKGSNNQDLTMYLFDADFGWLIVPCTNIVGGTIQSDGHWKATVAMNLSTSRLLIAGSNDNPGFSGEIAQLAVWPGHATTTSEISDLAQLAVSQWSGQTISERMNTVIQTVGWPTALSAVDTVPTIANDEKANLSSTNSLDYLHSLELSDGGWLFMNDGVLTYYSRSRLQRAPYSAVQFVLSDLQGDTDTVTGLAAAPYAELAPQFGDESLFNEASVSRQIDAETPGALQYSRDPVSQAKYFPRTFEEEDSLLLASDADALALSQWYVTYYAYPRLMFTSVKIKCFDDLTWQLALAAQIGMRGAILVHPMPLGTGGPIRVECTIQGISGAWQRGVFELTLSLGMAPPNVLLMNDAVYGKLDNGNRLGY